MKRLPVAPGGTEGGLQGRERRSTIPSSAMMLMFPIAHRVDFVERIASQILARPATEAEQHLQQQLRRQSMVLRREGITEAVIKRELASLQGAVRRALWRAVIGAPAPKGR
jgi:hypothetical protein